MRVARTVRLIEPESDDRFDQGGLSLADFRSDHSYILLGEPGIGKTTALADEAAEAGVREKLVSARRFLSSSANIGPERESGPLFIDGLDEVRTAGVDPREPLEKLQHQLRALRYPSFRLSCRSGRWLGANDSKALSSLEGYADLVVLELNPLTHDDVRQIVAGRGRAAEDFMRAAFDHGLDALLWNPQLLNVLLKSTESADWRWPANPTEAFERACEALAKEYSEGHRIAQYGDPRPSRDAVLRAAGKLSALMLIAGKVGWTVPDTDGADILSLTEIKSVEGNAWGAILDSALFHGPAACRRPTHRRIAEYLGARYLDVRMRETNGVSARRMLALLMGHDGIPLEDLRGLSGWLAALNPEVRQILIQADPIAIACYGDTSAFSGEECAALLESLESKVSIESAWIPIGVLAPLVGRLGASTIWALVAESNRSEARQQLVLLLLRGLSQMCKVQSEGRRKREAAEWDRDRDALLGLIRDATWWPEVRCTALESLGHLLSGSPIRQEVLKGLLAGIVAGQLQDTDEQIVSKLLDIMYPKDVLPSEVWTFLEVRPRAHSLAYFQIGWQRVVERSSDTQIRALLDSLCDQSSTLLPKLVGHRLDDFVLALLVRGLARFGEGKEIADLYRWLDLVTFDLVSSQLVLGGHGHDKNASVWAQSDEAIRSWLDSHREIQYKLVEYGLQQRASEIGKKPLRQTIGRKFIGVKAPKGFRRWCLDRAVALAGSRSKIAEELAGWSTFEDDGWGRPLSDAEVAQAVLGCPKLERWNDKRLKDEEQEKRKAADDRKRLSESMTAFQERRRAWLAGLRSNIEALKAGTCAPGLLHKLAAAYMDGLSGLAPSSNPHKQLASALEKDTALVDAALSGFRSLLDRDDLPDLAAVARLHERNRWSLFARPFLAGMEEEERTGGDALARLGKKARGRALGFYLLTPLPGRQYVRGQIAVQNARPEWFVRALAKHPQDVADAVVVVHNARVRAKSPPDQVLYGMLHEAQFDPVRPLAVGRMFTAFPSRCTTSQVDSLRLTLAAALCKGGMSTRRLRDLVTRRLQRKGMDVAQRAHWLCTGLYVAMESCLSALVDYLASGGEQRIWQVVRCLKVFSEVQKFRPDYSEWKAEDMARLIRVLGARIQPPKWKLRAGFLSDAEVAENHFEPLMESWVKALARRTNDEARVALESLARDPVLESRKVRLECALLSQAKRCRRDMHAVPTLKQIQETLRDGPPSSAADLHALLIDALRQLAQRIRNSSTNDWRQYWQSNGEGWAPLHENECRDALLSDLDLMLKRHGIHAQKEGYYADEKRADIRVAFGADIAIPVEIKKNTHRKLWRAANEQLATKYTRAPEAAGYGVYLVLWFGQQYTKTGPPRGRKPKSADELKVRLVSALDPEARARIGVVVVDVSRSDGAARNHSGRPWRSPPVLPSG